MRRQLCYKSCSEVLTRAKFVLQNEPSEALWHVEQVLQPGKTNKKVRGMSAKVCWHDVSCDLVRSEPSKGGDWPEKGIVGYMTCLRTFLSAHT